MGRACRTHGEKRFAYKVERDHWKDLDVSWNLEKHERVVWTGFI
jgi:hypothetical protein